MTHIQKPRQIPKGILNEKGTEVEIKGNDLNVIYQELKEEALARATFVAMLLNHGGI